MARSRKKYKEHLTYWSGLIDECIERLFQTAEILLEIADAAVASLGSEVNSQLEIPDAVSPKKIFSPNEKCIIYERKKSLLESAAKIEEAKLEKDEAKVSH